MVGYDSNIHTRTRWKKCWRSRQEMATHNAEEWLRIKKMIMIATFVGDDGDYYFVDDDGDEW